MVSTLSVTNPAGVKRRSSFSHPKHHNQAGLKFASSGGSSSSRGIRPLPEPTPMKELAQMLVVVACKKILFLDRRVRICLYLALTFLLSIVADAMPFPKTYFADSRNGLNAMFVGFGWGWTLLTTAALVGVVEIVRYCGDWRKVAVYHLSRLAVATLMWWAWTNAFSALEKSTGSCLIATTVQAGMGKRACRDASGKWRSFDVSGHTFLLIFCNLMMMEEARVINGWESIKDAIRREDFFRSSLASNQISAKPEPQSEDDTYLKDLSSSQFDAVKLYYSKFAVAARALFLLMTMLSIMHDVLLLSTLVYFHVMTEKLLAAAIAVCLWFVLYRVWFVVAPFPVPPGADGCFKCDVKPKQNKIIRKRDESRLGRRSSMTPQESESRG